MREVEIYSDGAARGNPGVGGYGALLRFIDADGKTHTLEISRGFRLTTNNRMELMGVIIALKTLKVPCNVRVMTDSQYVVKAFNDNWIAGWIKRGWKNSKNESVANTDLWKQLLELTSIHNVEFVWVKGHAGHPENERCDELATAAADAAPETLAIDKNYEILSTKMD